MRIGLIADIHGNRVALDAVLADLSNNQIDRVVCLGDLAVLGPQPREVIRRLQERNILCVIGNADAWLLANPTAPAVPPTSEATIDLTRWTADQLTPSDLAFLGHMPLSIDLMLSTELTVRSYHASPRSLDDVIAATTPAADLAEMGIIDHDTIYAGGHTHIQLVRRFGAAHIVNPGSVGLPGVGPGVPDLPVNRAVDWAEYAVIDASPERRSFDLRRVHIDVERVLAAGADVGMPHLDWWAEKWRRGD